MNWYLKVVRDNYANFSGRARRQEYWMFMLFHSVIIIVLAILTGLLVDLTDNGAYIAIFIGFYFLGTIIPTLAVTVRRLHDIGKSGWYFLLQLIPYVGGFIMFVFTLQPGNSGANQYGPDPKVLNIFDEIDDIGKPQ